MSRRPSAILAAGIALLFQTIGPQAADAHEFWIEAPQDPVAKGDEIKADLLVGLGLSGAPYPYLSNRIVSFDVEWPGGSQMIAGIDGDLPALRFNTEASGLHIVKCETVAFRAEHRGWDAFERYLAEEGLSEFVAAHAARGLPRSGFAERYTRYAKLLVPVGPAIGATDRAVGLTLELVLDGDVFAADAKTISATLLSEGRPVSGRQISLMHKAAPASRHTDVTDANGKATFSLLGPGAYLLNAVTLTPVDNAPVVWESRWASLSFHRQ